VSNDAEIDSVFAAIKEKYGKIDILVHAVAFAPAEELRGDFLNTSREGFRIAMDVSVYSLVAVSRAAAPLMTEGGSIMTLSFYAAEKVVPHYNVMALAKSALESAVRYLAYSLGDEEHPRQRHLRRPHQDAGRPRRRRPRRHDASAHAERAPLHRNVDQLEVGGAALFLASDLASAITGEIMYVDCGYNVMGFWRARRCRAGREEGRPPRLCRCVRGSYYALPMD
jgi:enoyl-[acyl-carrier protein] reductase I